MSLWNSSQQHKNRCRDNLSSLFSLLLNSTVSRFETTGNTLKQIGDILHSWNCLIYSPGTLLVPRPWRARVEEAFLEGRLVLGAVYLSRRYHSKSHSIHKPYSSAEPASSRCLPQSKTDHY